MLLECKNCGAPLDVRPSTLLACCRYCKVTSQTGQLKTVNRETPPGWRPPGVWLPPPHMPAAPLPLQYHPERAAFFLCVLGSLLAGGTLTIAMLFLTRPQTPATPAQAWPPDPPSAQERADAWDGRTTFNCFGNARVKLSNRTVQFGDTPAIVAADNCQLTLDHCTVKGNAPLTTSGNATVRIVGGGLTSLAPALPAATASGNSDIVLTSGAVLEAPTIAVMTSGNATVDAHGGRVIGTVYEVRKGSVRGVAPRASAVPSAPAPRPGTRK